MLIHITQVLSTENLNKIREMISLAEFKDGKSTAPVAASTGHKKNLQLTVKNEIGQQGWHFIKQILDNDRRIFELAHVKTILPFMFVRYEQGMQYGTHIDQPLMSSLDSQIRTDISMTLFLNSPEDYEGGELVLETDYGTTVCKANAGDLILYPSTMLHEVKPITKGYRLVAVGWMQSLIRDPQKRRILFDLNNLTHTMERASQPGVMIVKKTYYNLLRMWIDV